MYKSWTVLVLDICPLMEMVLKVCKEWMFLVSCPKTNGTKVKLNGVDTFVVDSY